MQAFLFHQVIAGMLPHFTFMVILLFDRADGETESQHVEVICPRFPGGQR